jgi:hypothetical protein
MVAQRVGGMWFESTVARRSLQRGTRRISGDDRASLALPLSHQLIHPIGSLAA